MILHALYDYYHRNGNLAPEGSEYKKIDFLLVIDHEGRFLRLEDRRDDKPFLVTKGSRSGTKPKPYLFWDNVEYILNFTKDHLPLPENEIDDQKKVANRQQKIEKSLIKHQASIARFQEIALKYPENKGFQAVCQFYENGEIERVAQDELWSVIEKKPTINLSFLLQGEMQIVAESKELINELDSSEAHTKENDLAICLITGNRGEIVDSTTPTAIPGAQATARLIAFQVNSGYDSYGKTKAKNAPISKSAEACYTTALNKLLAKDSSNKFLSGSRTFVLWSSSKSALIQELEPSLGSIFSFNNDQDDPNAKVERVQQLLRMIYSGKEQFIGSDRFYFLGLAPNSARIAPVFWADLSIKKFAHHLLTHFDDFDVQDTRKEKIPYKGLRQILSAVALKSKISDLQPNLPESLIQSILQGTPYPYTLYMACLNRIKSEQKVTITRIGILKSYLNRQYHATHKKIEPMLDLENNNIGYLCGRLFATLERIQNAAGADTLRSRYLNGASSTPAMVFPTLLNLSIHHLEKLDKGYTIFYETLKGEIIQGISAQGFPAHLDLKDQGRFMVGYYHQRQDLFTSKKEKLQEETINE